MDRKTEHDETMNNSSSTRGRIKRKCVPVVARLEDRGLLSAIGAEVASAMHLPVTVGPQIAEVDSATARFARREALAAARGAWVIHFPGGSVRTNRHGTHVTFPGGSVRANRHGAIVTFPGGFVISGLGHTVVRFPGGFIDI